MSRDPRDVKEELIQIYPKKLRQKRSEQIVITEHREDGSVPEIKSNVRSSPGIITQRGCTYAGCKGVIFGPTRDILNLVHGPIGCSFYAWLTRRNQTRTPTDGDANFMNYCLSTDMQEENIVFGGEKKLKAAVKEAFDLFHPKAIAIFSTCPVGLIGDDVHAVAREMSAELGINIFGLSCEGYRGVSQSAGHHIANNGLFKHIIGLDETPHDDKFKINLLGEYNIGGDGFVLEELFKRCGIKQISTFSGNSTYDSMANSHTADLNLVMCHRSINYAAEMMEKKFGIPWMKVNFIGAEATAKTLRKIAQYFEDAELTERVEQVIAEDMAVVEITRSRVKARCQGKTAMLFVGGSRAHHYQMLFTEIGMKTLAAGYEFGHRDDYEGRSVLPGLKVDADSRNIEQIDPVPDPERYRARRSPDQIAKLEGLSEMEFRDYIGMMPQMDDDTLVIDDLSHHETERLLEIYKPDIFCAGIKEKYAVQKMGIPCKQLHSYDYGGPYAGFSGAINFFNDIDRMVNMKIWSHVTPPWNTPEPQREEVAAD
ncbi:MAG TPA: nitrogenase molybdenum-iron protein alpha chain [Candidatus Saccharimonadales bacterium]|nr:nitrogenase molybdenum-iron protein alpha chain [Candidatus Saccharimonadales bacterium]